MSVNPSGAQVWRDYVTDGVPASGSYEPQKSSIRAWSGSVESLLSSVSSAAAIFDTRANLFATLTYVANTLAWVVADGTAAFNGIYRKSGGSGTGSWARVADLPYSFIVASDVGDGEPNAIEATSSLPISSSALVILNVFETNTGSPVTVAFNGGSPLTVKTNSGNDLEVGGLVPGALLVGLVSGSTFRLVSDQSSAALQAAAEAAKDHAEEWAQSNDPVSVAAGGDGSTDRSAKYWAAQAVGINWEGDYSSGTTYSLNDGVTFGGSSWRYINASSGSGNSPPTPPTSSNAHWTLIAGGGADGAPGGGLKGIGCTVVDTGGGIPAIAYEAGDTVNGTVLVSGDIILRATPGGDAADGIYAVQASGGALRHVDFDTWGEIYGGLFPAADGSLWQNTNGPSGTLGTTPLTFSDISSADVFSDAVFRVTDNADPTKAVAFQVSGVPTATTRTISVEKDVTLRPQAWEEIAKGAVTSVPSLDFIDLGAFRRLRLKATLFPVNDAVNLQLRTSVNNGGAYDSGSGFYAEQIDAIEGTTRTVAALSGASATAYFISAGAGIGNALNEAIEFTVELSNFNAAEYSFITNEAIFISNTGVFVRCDNGGTRSSAVARNAFRVLFSSGNIARGHYVLEGVRG